MYGPKHRRQNVPSWIVGTIGVIFLILPVDVAFADVDRWEHFTIESPLPGEKWGCGGPVIADFDGDGDLDMALSRRTTQSAYWYERVTDAKWIRHTMGSAEGLKGALGMAVADLDGDGWPDVVSNRVWFSNPGKLATEADATWPSQEYDSGGHDIVAADINLDGRTDIVANNGQFWFDTAAGMEKVTVWTDREYHFHGGVAPRGIGDLDNDGDLDIVMPGLWFANPGNGRGTWARQKWPHLEIPKASYGTSARSWVVDLNNDGWRDIVYSDCDTGHSHVYWVENQGRGMSWQRHKLTDPPTRQGDVPGTGSFHSLGVADFDGDGDLDIFGGEQEDPDTYMEKDGKLAMKPRGLKERGVVWENIGSRKQPEFRPTVFQLDNPGWHEATLGDVDGDGDLDIVSKIWNADGQAYHADYWRNDNSKLSIPTSKPTNKELMLIDEVFVHEDTGTMDKKMGFSEFPLPEHIPSNWESPIPYRKGRVHFRVSVLSKPTDKPIHYHIGFQWKGGCDGHPFKEKFPNNRLMRITKPGLYTWSQAITTWWEQSCQKEDPIDWTERMTRILVVVWDDQPKPIDDRWGYGSPKVNLKDYYPMAVHCQAVVVPPGKEFSGWQNYSITQPTHHGSDR